MSHRSENRANRGNPPRRALFSVSCTAILAAAVLLASLAQAAAGPTIKSAYISGVSTTTATLNAQIDPLGAATTCRFEYGADETYGSEVPCAPEVQESIALKVAATAGQFKLALGADTTTDLPFDATPAEVKSALQALPSLAGSSTAVTGGPGDATGSHPYEISLSGELPGGAIEPLEVGAGTTPLSGGSGATSSTLANAHAQLSGLSPATTYHYRALAANANGNATGGDRWLHTYAEPVSEPETCPNAARREEQHATFLPDCRAYELASPPDKNGADVTIESRATRASEGESPGLPAAVSFESLGYFADARGGSVSTEYLSQRDAAPGTRGWSTHAITPAQQPTSFAADGIGLEPAYDAEMSADLTKGLFRSWSPLTEAANVALISDLYRREDLRAAGAGTYSLLSDSASPVPAPKPTDRTFAVPATAAATPDLSTVLFEDKQARSADAAGRYPKLYLSQSPGVPRLIDAGPGCPGGDADRGPGPCSAAGAGATAQKYTLRTLSTDGSRVEFSSPVDANGGSSAEASPKPGAESRVFQLDTGGTATTADDALIELNASEATAPEATKGALFQTASVNGNRVFFTSPEKLVDGATGGGLYMWQRAAANEVQRLAVSAEGGSFTLTAHAQPTRGKGNITAGSDEVTCVSAGSFMVGQTVSGPGIPAGTWIEAMGGFRDPSTSTLTLSSPATSTTTGATIAADVEATTPPLPFNASAAGVQSALEALTDEATTGESTRPLIGQGNVKVSGGPGGPGAATPYGIEFSGGLAGVDVMPLTASAAGLTGSTHTAALSVTTPVRNVSRIAKTGDTPYTQGVIGASEDGHRLYFATLGSQLVAGAPPLPGGGVENGIYYWQDAEGPAAGTLSFVGWGSVGDLAAVLNYSLWSLAPKVSRVSPDGKTLLFELSDGSGLAPGYDQLACRGQDNPNNDNGTGGCSEAYLYRADGSTPTEPNLLCASCSPSGARPVASAFLNVRKLASAAAFGTHLNRALSADGRYVFFSSKDPLVPRDTNGAFDAYEYDSSTGEVHLLSSGTSPYDSYFLDASANGHDVYVITRQPLLGWDTDGAYDVYDVRVGGGFPEPPPAPAICEGESCLPSSGAPPSPSSVGSGREGAGNPKQSRCPKGKVRRHGRCVAKRRHHRHAHHHRRAAK